MFFPGCLTTTIVQLKSMKNTSIMRVSGHWVGEGLQGVTGEGEFVESERNNYSKRPGPFMVYMPKMARIPKEGPRIVE
jgi:hypothetical protein